MPALHFDRPGRASEADQLPTHGRKARNRASKAAFLTAVLCALSIVPATASAADAQWSGAGTNSNSFTNPFNWFGNFIPGVNDRAVFVPAGGIWPGPVFGSGTITNSQAFISSGVWQFFGGNAGENWRVNNDITLSGTNAIFNGVDVFAGSTNIANGCFLGVAGSTDFRGGTIATQGAGIFNVGTGSVMRGTISAAGTGTCTVDGTLDSTGFDLSGGGQVSVGSSGALFLGADSQVSNGTLLMSGFMSPQAGFRLRITGNSSALRFTGNHTLQSNTNLDVRAGGDIIAPNGLTLITGMQTIDGSGSTINVTAPGSSAHWGLGGSSTVTFSNFGVGTYQFLELAGNQNGRVDSSILSNSQLNVMSNLFVGPFAAQGTSSLCRMTVNGGTVNCNGSALFQNGGQLVVSGGFDSVVNFTGGDATFAGGSTLTVSGGRVNIASGRTLSIDGGVVNRTGGTSSTFTGIPNGTTLRIANGGKFTTNTYFDVANNESTGTLLVTGAGSQFVSLNDVTDFGFNTGNFATVTFSNGGVGTYDQLRLGTFGGKALVNINSNGLLNNNGLGAGGSISGSAATINIAGGVLNNNGLALFGSGAVVNLMPSGGLYFSGGVSIDGGVINQTGGDLVLLNGVAVSITNAGRLTTNTYFNVAAGNPTGTLLVSGANSRITSTAGLSDFGATPGSFATVTFANGGAGTFAGLRVGSLSGKALLNINTGGALTVNSLSAADTDAGSAATINIAGGSLNVSGNAFFSNGAAVNLASDGFLNFGGNATFSTGATITGSGDGLVIAPSRTMTFNGGVGSLTDSYALPDGATMRITNGGLFRTGLYFDVARSVPTGTLLVDGPGSRVVAGGTTPTDWGAGLNTSATVTFSNSGVGTYTGLRLGRFGGTARLNINSNAALNLGSLGTGGNGAANVSINITGGSLTATGSTGFENATVIDVNSAGALQLGTNSTFFAGSTMNINGGTFRATGAVDVHGGATINYNSGTANVTGSLNLGAFGSGAQVQLTAGRNKVLRVGGVNIQNGGKINLADNALIVDYTGASPLPTIRTLVATGRTAVAAWNGPGINSSSAAANNRTGLGLLEATEIGSPATFLGQPIDDTSVLARFVFLGDSNLDGTVNIADFALLGSNFNLVTHSWFKGDYNYDGASNISDFALLASNFNFSLPAELPRGGAVPEPLGGSILIIAGFSAQRRRR